MANVAPRFVQVLRPLQGTVLPRMFGVGRLESGYGFLAMSVIRGTPLSRLSEITPAVVAAAEAALAQVCVSFTVLDTPRGRWLAGAGDGPQVGLGRRWAPVDVICCTGDTEYIIWGFLSYCRRCTPLELRTAISSWRTRCWLTALTVPAQPCTTRNVPARPCTALNVPAQPVQAASAGRVRRLCTAQPAPCTCKWVPSNPRRRTPLLLPACTCSRLPPTLQPPPPAVWAPLPARQSGSLAWCWWTSAARSPRQIIRCLRARCRRYAAFYWMARLVRRKAATQADGRCAGKGYVRRTIRPRGACLASTHRSAGRHPNSAGSTSSAAQVTPPQLRR